MQRSVGFLVAGILIGILVGFVLAPSSQKPETAGVSSAVVASNHSATRSESLPQKSDVEKSKILLGDITTLPFQELYGLLSSRSREEVMEIAQQLKELPAGKETNAKIGVFFKAWAHLDAKTAFTVAASFKSGEAKGAAIGAVIVVGSLAASITELPAEVLSPAEKTNFLSRTLTKWSQLDPVAAAKFLDAIPGGARGLTGVRISIAENWAASDPQAALAWAQGRGDDPDATFAISGAVLGWWHTDPQAAEAYVASHLSTLGSQAAMSLTRQIFSQDPQHAKDWANQLPSVELRRNVNSFIAMQLAATDPKGASEWAVALPDDVRERALYGVVSAWARNDSAAVGQWIDSLGGAPRDDALSAYSSTLSMKDPARALTWVASISDEKIRDGSMQRILAGWLNRSPNEATAWIQNSTLSDAEKMRLLALSAGR
jgi:hypothetical protein